MASEALPTDQKTNEIFAENKIADDTETAMVESVQKQNGESDAQVEVPKKEENHDNASHDLAGNDVAEAENPKLEEQTSTPGPVVEVTEEMKRHGDLSVTPEEPHEVIDRPKEDITAPPLQEPGSEDTKESAVLGSVSEEGNSAEKDKEISSIPDSTSKTKDKPEEPLTPFSAATPASNNIKTSIGDNSIETLDEGKNAIKIEPTAKPLKEEVTDPSKFEGNVEENVSSDAGVTDAAELKASGEGAVTLEASDAPKMIDASSQDMRRVEESVKEEIASDKFEGLEKEAAVDAPAGELALAEAVDANSVAQITENPVQPEVKFEEEKQEQSVEAEVPILSETDKMSAGGEVVEMLSSREKASTGNEMVKEKKENLEDTKIVETSKDLDVAASITEVPSEEGKTSESAQIVESEDENLEQEKTSSKGFVASTESAEHFAEGEKAHGFEMVGELKDENLKDDMTVLAKTTPGSLDSVAEVAGVVSERSKAFEGLEMVKEEKHEAMEGGKPSTVEASENLDSSTGTAEVVEEKKGESLEVEEPLLDTTSKDSAEVAKASSVEERAFEHVELVKEKKDEEEKTSAVAETTEEDKGGSLKEGMTSAGTFEVLDVEGKNASDTSTKEPLTVALEADQDKGNAKEEEGSEKLDEKKITEPAKEGDATRVEGEVPKHEPSAKSSQRHSGNIISKVKQSIVKVKKAIIGKSPSPKSMTTGAKETSN